MSLIFDASHFLGLIGTHQANRWPAESYSRLFRVSAMARSMRFLVVASLFARMRNWRLPELLMVRLMRSTSASPTFGMVISTCSSRKDV